MQSSSDVGPFGKPKQPAKCLPSSGNASESIAPEISVTGTRWARACSATTNGALRNSVCASLRPFAGDRPVGARERGVQTDQVGHDFRAGLERAAQQLQREAQSAGRAGAG